MKKGDLISLSIKKKYKGIFHKEWTGEWEEKLSIFLNVTIHHYWRVDSKMSMLDYLVDIVNHM